MVGENIILYYIFLQNLPSAGKINPEDIVNVQKCVPPTRKLRFLLILNIKKNKISYISLGNGFQKKSNCSSKGP